MGIKYIIERLIDQIDFIATVSKGVSKDDYGKIKNSLEEIREELEEAEEEGDGKQ